MIARLLLVPLLAAAIGIPVGGRSPSSQGSARPDRSFGGGKGWVTTAMPGADAQATAAVVTPDNRIVVAGSVTSGNNSQALVARYQGNGLLDQSFGSNGIFTTALPGADGPFLANAIGYQPSSRGLVVAGGYGQDSILLLRLTLAGKLDPTFGGAGTGIVKAPVGDYALSLAIDADGRILVGSSNRNEQNRPFVVARFSPNGRPDTSFGQGGTAQVGFWDPLRVNSSGVSALSVADDGSVTAAGHLDYIGGDGHGSAGVFRLSPSGQLVPGFASNGHIEIGFTGSAGTIGTWYPCTMVVDSLGRLVVTGFGAVSPQPALLTARLTPSGTLDPSFGTAGRAITSGLGSDIDNALNCGAVTDARNSVTIGLGSTLVQLTASGVPNTRFAPGGFLAISTPPQVSLNALVRPGTGRVVLVGFAGPGGQTALYVARYLTH